MKGRGVPLGYVEGLNDARTKLAGFFSILLRDHAQFFADLLEGGDGSLELFSRMGR